MGAKRTSDLIPLCHPINLTNIQVELQLRRSPIEKHEEYSRKVVTSANGPISRAGSELDHWVQVGATAQCVGATGVEMEALTAVSISCLTVWDMLKAAAGKEMTIDGIMVIKKSGGKSADWERPQ